MPVRILSREHRKSTEGMRLGKSPLVLCGEWVEEVICCHVQASDSSSLDLDGSRGGHAEVDEFKRSFGNRTY